MFQKCSKERILDPKKFWATVTVTPFLTKKVVFIEDQIKLYCK